jgi:hypothetical protein
MLVGASCASVPQTPDVTVPASLPPPESARVHSSVPSPARTGASADEPSELAPSPTSAVSATALLPPPTNTASPSPTALLAAPTGVGWRAVLTGSDAPHGFHAVTAWSGGFLVAGHGPDGGIIAGRSSDGSSWQFVPVPGSESVGGVHLAATESGVVLAAMTATHKGAATPTPPSGRPPMARAGSAFRTSRSSGRDARSKTASRIPGAWTLHPLVGGCSCPPTGASRVAR